MSVLPDYLGVTGHGAGGLCQPDRDRLLGIDQVHQHGAVECRAAGHPRAVRPGPHGGGFAVRADALKPVTGGCPVGDVERLIGRVETHPATGTHSAQCRRRRGLIDGGRLLDSNHLAGQGFRIGGQSRITGISGLNNQRRRAGEEQ